MIQKIKSKKGFTLAELLIVVAIIGVLVAIAIPVFTGALAKADTAVVDANLRSARAEASVQYLLNERKDTAVYTFTVSKDGKMTMGTPATATTGDKEACTKQGDGSYTGTVIVDSNDLSKK